MTAESEAYQRVLATARELFYRKGYRATGINEIIRRSGVAKATFYAHFPSKEDLALAYVKSMNRMDLDALEASLAKHPGPYEKLVGLMEFLIPWARANDYRGCAHLNLSVEITECAHPVREETRDHYTSIRALVGRLTNELKVERGAAWKGRDAEKVADDYVLIFAGALALGQVYHDPKPFRQSVDAVKRLLG